MPARLGEEIDRLRDHLTPVFGRLDPSQPAGIDLRRIGKGKANLTYELLWGGGRYVLRRPPEGDLPESAHDMLREARVMSALRSTAVPVPRIVHVCEDREILGHPFYLMEFVDGYVIRDAVPPDLHAAGRWALGIRVAAALADIHQVDYRAVGLEGLGKGAGYVGRQLRRWQRQWASASTRSIPEVEQVGAWLAEHQPAEETVCLVHGDFKLDNVVVGHGSPSRIASVLDWEMSTLGDPLADLGYLLLFWPEPGEASIRGIRQPTQEPGFPRRREVVAEYERRTGRVAEGLDFYVVLALWKAVIIFEGLYRLHREKRLGETDQASYYAAMETRVPELAARAWNLCQRAHDGKGQTVLATM